MCCHGVRCTLAGFCYGCQTFIYPTPSCLELSHLCKVISNHIYFAAKYGTGMLMFFCRQDKSDFSSVHKAAVTVYEEIFKTLGPNRLAQDLFIYSAGLFPALEFVDLGAKGPILNLYATYLVPLGERLRPSLQGVNVFVCH
jgi:Dopey, N-terminal